MSYADRKIEALNSLTKQVRKALPKMNTDNTRVMAIAMNDDVHFLEVQSAVKDLIETIINEAEDED